MEDGQRFCPFCSKAFQNAIKIKEHIGSEHLGIQVPKEGESMENDPKTETFKVEEISSIVKVESENSKIDESKMKDSPKVHEINVKEKQPLKYKVNGFACNECSVSFNQIMDFKNHLKIAHNEKVLQPKVQNKIVESCNDFKTLRKPQKTEKGWDRYFASFNKQDQKGSKIVESEQSQKIQPKVNGFTCKQCNVSFNEIVGFKDHLKIAHEHKKIPKSKPKVKSNSIENGNDFGCLECNLTFDSFESFKEHVNKTHESFQLHGCKNCNFLTQNEGILKSHMNSNHKEIQN